MCFGCFDSSNTRACPYCGHEPELTERELENIKEIELQEITEAKVQKLKNEFLHISVLICVTVLMNSLNLKINTDIKTVGFSNNKKERVAIATR